MPQNENRWLNHLQKNIIIGLLTALLAVTVVYYQVPKYQAEQRLSRVHNAAVAYKRMPHATPEEKQAAFDKVRTLMGQEGFRASTASADWYGGVNAAIPAISDAMEVKQQCDTVVEYAIYYGFWDLFDELMVGGGFSDAPCAWAY